MKELNVLILLDLNGLIDWIIDYIGNVSGIIQVIITLVALVFAFLAWRGLKKESKDRKKQIESLEKLVTHRIITRRNSIKPELKAFAPEQRYGSNQVTYKFSSVGKKPNKISYDFTKGNRDEFNPASKSRTFDLDRKIGIAIPINYLVDEITEPIEITIDILP